MATTQIREAQIADGAISDAKVKAGAAIATSKLADGLNFIKKDGSVVMTGSLDSGNQKIINVGTPTNTTDAATKSYVDGLIAGVSQLVSFKAGVRAKSTGNVNIANPGTAVFDTITLVNANRLLLASQTASAENGIYVFNGSGSPLTRSTDFDTWSEIPGSAVIVEEGATAADTLWISTANDGGTIGTTAITFSQLTTGGGGYTNANFVDKEVPSGTKNGSNATFTLANTPTSGSEHLYLNGILQNVGSGNDYTITGATITMLNIPLASDVLLASYRK